MDLQVVGAAAFWLVCAEAQVREAHHLRNRRGLVGVGLSSVVEAQGLVMVLEAEVPVEALVVEVVQVVVVEVAMAGVVVVVLVQAVVVVEVEVGVEVEVEVAAEVTQVGVEGVVALVVVGVVVVGPVEVVVACVAELQVPANLPQCP